MTVATIETGLVSCTKLADGMVVRLAGELGDEQLAALRDALLRPAGADIRDVVVDAGDVYAVSPAALAVLVAAHEWAVTGGRRFMLSRTSEAIEDALADCGIDAGLPRLHALGDDDGAVVIPVPRPAEA